MKIEFLSGSIKEKALKVCRGLPRLQKKVSKLTFSLLIFSRRKSRCCFNTKQHPRYGNVNYAKFLPTSNSLYKLAGFNAHPQLTLKAGDCLPAV
jgi:hypothetical protein